MLKITRIEGTKAISGCRGGQAGCPWTNELKKACEQARAQLNGQKLVVDVQRLTVISEEGRTSSLIF